MTPDDADEPAPCWKPKPAQGNKNPKRKASRLNPWANLGEYRTATLAQLDECLSELGPDFELITSDKERLLKQINDVVLNVADYARRIREVPPPSEIRELMRAVEGVAKQLLNTLGIERSPDKIYEQGALSQELNPWICQHLAAAANPHRPDRVLIANAATAVAALATLAAQAGRQADPTNLKTDLSLDTWISTTMALLYRGAFRREPARTEGGPWLKFLRWGLKLAGSPRTSAQDEQLRRLPVVEPRSSKGVLSRRRRDSSP